MAAVASIFRRTLGASVNQHSTYILSLVAQHSFLFFLLFILHFLLPLAFSLKPLFPVFTLHFSFFIYFSPALRRAASMRSNTAGSL